MIYKLNQNQIEQIQEEIDKNKKKDLIQDIGIDIFKKSNFNLICTWATSVGKTVYACKILKKIRQTRSDEIHVCVPYEPLKEQWEKTLKQWGIENVKVFIINTYLKEERNPYMLIVDECHYMISNPETKASLINDYKIKYRLYLSATLKKDQLHYLAEKGLKDRFEITLKEAKLLDLVPDFEIYNVLVELTPTEKENYKKYIEEYNYAMDYFRSFNINKLPKFCPTIPGEDPKVVSARYYTAMGKRAKYIAILYNAKNKIEVVKQILPYLSCRKTIFFAKSVKVATQISKLDDMLLYHSLQHKNLASKVLDLFLKGEKNKISSVNKLIAGIDDKYCDTIVRHSYDSTVQSSIQSLGRLLRINNDEKVAVVINLVCKPFEDITPNDNFWISNANRGLSVEWVHIEELIELLKEKC